ncbi:MAG: hypothetical protein ACRDHZ_26005, partial [Ktedonobacteraceae bacterium]
VYTALERGTVDGALGGLGGAVGLKYYEPVKHMFAQMGVLGVDINGYVMNKKKFDELPTDLQKVITRSATDARNHCQEAFINEYSKELDQVRKAGKDVYVLKQNSPQWDQWRKAIAPLLKKQASEYPQKLVKLIR